MASRSYGDNLTVGAPVTAWYGPPEDRDEHTIEGTVDRFYRRGGLDWVEIRLADGRTSDYLRQKVALKA